MFDKRNLLCCLRILHRVGVVLAVFVGGQLALAQSFEWDDDKIAPAYEQQTTRSKRKTIKTQVVMGRLGLSSNQAEVDSWYREYLFPLMASRRHLAELHDNRRSLEKDLQRATDQATHQFLLDLAFEEASKRVTGNYHPAVRFNAMLIIGNLNLVEQRRAERLPPIRFPRAFDFLLSELQKPDQLDVLRLGAMVGIKRHLLLVSQRPQDQPIPDGTKAEVVELMSTLAQQKTSADGRSDEVHAWLRRRAVDVLGAAGQVGDNRAVFNLLVDIASDGDEPVGLRCAATRAIGDLDYTEVSGIDPVATAQRLGGLVVQVCEDVEADVSEKHEKLEEAQMSRGGYAGMGGGGGLGPEGGYGGPGAGGLPGMEAGVPGMDAGVPGGGGEFGYPGETGRGRGQYERRESEEVRELMERARRRLKLPIYCAQLGIRGEERTSFGSSRDEPQLGSIAQLASEDAQKNQVQEILAALEDLIDATDYVEEGMTEMLAEVSTSINRLEGILPDSALAEEEPEEEEESLDSALPGADVPEKTDAEPDAKAAGAAAKKPAAEPKKKAAAGPENKN